MPVSGAFLIGLEPLEDHRGFNARLWCRKEFGSRSLSAAVAQVNLIANGPRGTLRGLHYQAAPRAETKLFRVTRGAIYDVILDLRPESPTYRRWAAVELRATETTALLVPEGVAQGFQTLEDGAELIYLTSELHSPDHGRGVRYDDPAFAIPWPLEVTAISEKDRSWADFADVSPRREGAR